MACGLRRPLPLTLGVARQLGVHRGVMGASRLTEFLWGAPCLLSEELLLRYPELRSVRWRRGGLPPRIGGWCLGMRSVAAITLWRTVWLGADVYPVEELLLHEFCHVQQFDAVSAFPVRYVWESLRRGYLANRFEVEARQYAIARMQLPA